MNLSTFQSTFPLKLSSSITLTLTHLISIPNWSLRLTFPPPPASPPAPVCDPPAGLPGPLCWTSGSPLDETLCSSDLCSREVTKREVMVLNWTNVYLYHNHIREIYKLEIVVRMDTIKMKVMKRHMNEMIEALFWVCSVTLCVVVFVQTGECVPVSPEPSCHTPGPVC